MRCSCAVIALGNLLLSDEGVGVHILQALENHPKRPKDVDLIDSGNSSMTVLHGMTDRKKVVFVDCALMDEAPGTIRRFTPEEVRTRKNFTGLSLHDGDLLVTLELAKQLEGYPDQVVIFGIQPSSWEPGDRLSPLLQAKLGNYVDAVWAELKKGFSCETEKVRPR